MGVNSRRPPLPAPTESNDEGGTTSGLETDVATNVTGKTSYSIPEDGSPVTISTQKVTSGSREPGHPGHHRSKSQTSLLIEYFEDAKSGNSKSRSRPSVRVRVSPSARKKAARSGNDAVQITGIGKDRKPSYTRRISLGESSKRADPGNLAPTEGTELSYSSESNVSGHPPVEVEVLGPNASEMSTQSRGLMYAQNESNVSSMPPDSMLEESHLGKSDMDRSELDRSELEESTVSADDKRTRGAARDDDHFASKSNYLKAPTRTRSRSKSQERITQKVMEKLGQSGLNRRKSSKSKSDRNLSKDFEYSGDSRDRRHRSSKQAQFEEEKASEAASSLLSSNVAGQRSALSGSDMSKSSNMRNNPKLLEMVEDTIKRMILPEINAIKEDQRTERRGSLRGDGHEGEGVQRRVSKSSSTPNISKRPKVVLNREGDDPGTVLSRGDSERKTRKTSDGSYKEERPSSRRSSGGRHARYEDDASTRQSSNNSLTADALKHHNSRGHGNDRHEGYERHERRKKRNKSRGSHSRSASVAEESEQYSRKEDIPPMPMASKINDSEMTRESLVSNNTERPGSDVHTPVREVSRASFEKGMSPASPRTPSRQSGARSLGMSQGNRSIDSPKSANSSHGGRSTKERMAALTAAAAGGVSSPGTERYRERSADRSVDADGYGGSPVSRRQLASPVQSVSSLKKNFEEDSLIPKELRPKSAASRSSAGRSHDKHASRSSLQSGATSPGGKSLGYSRKNSQTVGDEFITPMERPEDGWTRDGTATPTTPRGEESLDDWYERQHQLNDQYRSDLDGQSTGNNRDSYQTNPYPQDEKRFTNYTDDSEADAMGGAETEQDVRRLGANPLFMQAPQGVESNVASLMDPSTVSSFKQSSVSSPMKGPGQGSYSDRMAAHLRDMGQDGPAVYEGSTLSQNETSQDRWAAIKGNARNMSSTNTPSYGREDDSLPQSPAKSFGDGHSSPEQPIMGASGMPVADDPMPEIGHYDSKSDLTTNPSIIQGPLGGDATGKDTWPYSPEPPNSAQGGRDSASLHSGHSRNGAALAAAGGAAAAAGLAGARAARQPSVEDESEIHRSGLTPDVGRRGQYLDRENTPGSPGNFRDEGYVTDAHARSAGAQTPRAGSYSKHDVEDFNRAMDAQGVDDEDPFAGDVKHARHVSGNSHGMTSPLYDSSTGKGIDNIQSKDVVALMDHLTVRDAQRNARDTEILVTLVRSAAEMRTSFDEMKKFIVEQDRMIMQNTDRDADKTVQNVQKVLGGPRPQPAATEPRGAAARSEDDVQTKRKGVLRRALKGLTGGKSTNDLSKVEDMLMQILGNVEDLKHQGATPQQLDSYTNDTLDSYERLRNAPDSGYEPEGQAGTSSTPSHSGHFSLTPKAEKHQFHSGYDGRRGSVNRVSTVMEGDEEDYLPHESRERDDDFDEGDRSITPTQQRPNFQGEQNELTPRSAEKQRKHKSNNSSVFGVPKISRWSKTTSSSAAPDPATLDSPYASRNQRPSSQVSRSGSALAKYDDQGYELDEDDRLRSTQSLAREQDATERRSMRSQASRLTRTPSPLIPSEVSATEKNDYEDDRTLSSAQEDYADEDYDDRKFDDPKYQAYRNSLPLQHPQPRQGATPRHQNTLETQAQHYDGPGDAPASATASDLSQQSGSDFDPAMWGSAGTAGLAKHRLSVADPASPASARNNSKDDSPLVPSSQQQQQKSAPPPRARYEEPEFSPEPEQDEEPRYSHTGFSRGGYQSYSSPFGSGHLLEPIEEVRYSLETDSGHISPEPQVASAKAVDMRSPGRQITGPRPMGAREMKGGAGGQAKLVQTSGSGGGGSAAVRRKPVAGSRE